MITASYLRKLLQYDPISGDFTWIGAIGRAAKEHVNHKPMAGLSRGARNMREPVDITSKIGQLHPWNTKPEWPMYSFDRPAYIVWNAIADELDKRGWPETMIKEWLQSKNPRWALDGNLGDMLANVAREYAKQRFGP